MSLTDELFKQHAKNIAGLNDEQKRARRKRISDAITRALAADPTYNIEAEIEAVKRRREGENIRVPEIYGSDTINASRIDASQIQTGTITADRIAMGRSETPPDDPVVGQLFMDFDNTLYVYNGARWVQVQPGDIVRDQHGNNISQPESHRTYEQLLQNIDPNTRTGEIQWPSKSEEVKQNQKSNSPREEPKRKIDI